MFNAYQLVIDSMDQLITPDIRICMYCPEVNLSDKVALDKVCPNLIAGIVLLPIGNRIAIESFHSYCQQVLAVNGLHIGCHLLDPLLQSHNQSSVSIPGKQTWLAVPKTIIDMDKLLYHMRRELHTLMVLPE